MPGSVAKPRDLMADAIMLLLGGILYATSQVGDAALLTRPAQYACPERTAR